MKSPFRKPQPQWAEPLSYYAWSDEIDQRYNVTPPELDTIGKRRAAYDQYVKGFNRS
jgi:hypothetical protein